MATVTLTRPMVEVMVRGLFTNGAGRRVTRLVLVDESSGKPGKNLGGLCEAAVVDRLCELLGVEAPAPTSACNACRRQSAAHERE